MIWIPCDKMTPSENGVYLVTTANGKVRFDRYFDGTWGLCNPRNCRGRYKDHLAWGYVPDGYQPREGRI